MKKKLNELKSYLFKDKTVFAKGLCCKKIFLIFIIGSIIGCYYEQILNLIKHYLIDGSIFWERRRGVIYTPLSPVYGAGAVLITLILLRKKLSSIKIFLYSALIGGIFEYVISFLQEKFIGSISWNYSEYFLNINGRTTVPFMLIWGLCGLIFVKIIYPFISNLIELIPYNLGNIIYIILLVITICDMTISWTALIRQNFRKKDYPSLTFIGKFYDKIYTDEKLAKYFPNMVSK